MGVKGDFKVRAATAKKNYIKKGFAVKAAEQCQNSVVGRCVFMCCYYYFLKIVKSYPLRGSSR